VGIRRGRPVVDFNIEFEWNEGQWELLFDEQVKLIREDIQRARVADRLIVYLSCPISSRGGGWSAVNVDITQSTERRLIQRYGERVWILNPAQYQMESKEGTGLIRRHAMSLGISDQELELLRRTGPIGGDYMRMWTRVLVEDEPIDELSSKRLPVRNTGRYFDAFYFLGPRDVAAFFTDEGPGSISAGVEAYFARRFATDPDFRDGFSIPAITWGDPSAATAPDQIKAREAWEHRRKDLIRFYTLKASTAFSKGSHDEWNIALEINRRRLAGAKGDVGELLSIWFDGSQVELSAFEAGVYHGYAVGP